MKVYVVEIGEYEEKHPVAVYSTFELVAAAFPTVEWNMNTQPSYYVATGEFSRPFSDGSGINTDDIKVKEWELDTAIPYVERWVV